MTTIMAAPSIRSLTRIDDVSWDIERESLRRAREWLEGGERRTALSRRCVASDAAVTIRGALHCDSALDSRRVLVQVLGDGVRLIGTVSSDGDRLRAELSAWLPFVVTHVQNDLVVAVAGTAPVVETPQDLWHSRLLIGRIRLRG